MKPLWRTTNSPSILFWHSSAHECTPSPHLISFYSEYSYNKMLDSEDKKQTPWNIYRKRISCSVVFFFVLISRKTKTFSRFLLYLKYFLFFFLKSIKSGWWTFKLSKRLEVYIVADSADIASEWITSNPTNVKYQHTNAKQSSFDIALHCRCLPYIVLDFGPTKPLCPWKTKEQQRFLRSPPPQHPKGDICGHWGFTLTTVWICETLFKNRQC